MRILGIDPSLVCTGTSFYNSETDFYLTDHIPTKELRGIKRLATIRDTIKELIDTHNPQIVFIEAYAYGGRGQDMGEVGGILRLLCYDNLIRFVEITPQHLKKFVTSKGNAGKKDVIDKCNSRFGTKFKWKNPSNNESDKCDAYCLMRIGQQMINVGVDEFMEEYELNSPKRPYNIELKK